jgi:hypothetical protein
MLRMIKRAVVIIAVGTTGIFASIGTAHAATGPARLTSVTAVTTTAPPSSSIKGAGATRKFVPATVTAAPVSGTCSPTNYSFLIKNLTKRPQQVMYNGAALGSPIKTHQSLLVCADGAGTGTLDLKGDAKAKLTFTIT